MRPDKRPAGHTGVWPRGLTTYGRIYAEHEMLSKTRVLPCLSMVYRVFSANEHHIRRLSDQYVLLFVLENALYFEEDGEPVCVRAGEWYLQRPNCMHTGRLPSPGVFYFFVHFDAAALPVTEDDERLIGCRQEREKAQSIVLPVRGRQDPSWRTAFDKLLQMHLSPDSALETQACFLRLLHAVYRSTLQVTGGGDALSERVLRYLIRRFPDEVTAGQIEEEMHYSYDHLSGVFRRKYGCPPVSYYRGMKIRKAQELLTHTDMPMQQIASALGFGSESQFYKAFKKHVGAAPSAWRKRPSIGEGDGGER